MALVIKDRVKEACLCSGLGVITPNGAVTSFRTIASQMSAADTAYFTLVDSAGLWITFLGTWNGSTVARTTIHDGSSGAGVNVSLAVTGTIFIDATAYFIAQQGGLGQWLLSLPTAPQVTVGWWNNFGIPTYS